MTDPNLPPTTPPQPPRTPDFAQEPANRSLADMVGEYQRQRQQQDDLALRNVFQAAVKTDPKAAAEAATLAQRLQTTPEQLPDDLEVARALAKERQFDELKASLTDPMLRERFKDVKFVRMLHDDLGNLKTTVDTFDWFWRNYESGATINEAGELKARQAFLRHNGGDLPPGDIDRIAEIDRIQQAAEVETGFFDEAAKLLGQMVQPAVRATGAGLLAAGAAAPTGVGAAGAFTATSLTAYATQAAVVEFGHQYSTIYEQLTAAGVDPMEAHETALLTGGAYALGAGAIEGLSGGIVGKPFLAAGKLVGKRILGLARPTVGRAAGTFARETLQGIAAETGEEGAQELLGALAQNIAGQMQGKDTGPSLEEALKAAGEVMLKTAKGMAVLGPIGPAMHFAADTRRVAEAKKAEELFTRIDENTKNSQVAKRSPDVLKQVVDAKTQGTELDAVFVSAPRLAEALRTLGYSREQFAASAPVAAKRLSQAEAEGGDVEIPMGEFATGIAGSELFPALKPALRTRYGATIEEAQQFEAEREQNKAEAAKAVAEARARVADWGAQADRVEQRMLAEVRSAATNLSPTQATHYATLHRHWVETQAARMGMAPEAFDAQFRATVKSNRTDDAGLVSQDTPLKTDTPEFRAWFGESKIVDEKGAPRVVYHGTNVAFDSFRGDVVGSGVDAGKLGAGFYFSEDANIASSYANLTRAKRGMTGPQVYPVYVAMRNPLVFAADQGSLQDKLRQASSALGVTEDPVADVENNRPSPEWAAKFSDALRRAGYDGVVLDFGEGRRELMALESTQIKSVNNRGTFGPNDPNILRQDAPPLPEGALFHGSPRRLDSLRAGSMLTDQPAWAAGYTTRDVYGEDGRASEQFVGQVHAVAWKPSNPIKVIGGDVAAAEDALLRMEKLYGIDQAGRGLQSLAKAAHEKLGNDAIVVETPEGKVVGMIPLVDVKVDQWADPRRVLTDTRKAGGAVADNLAKILDRSPTLSQGDARGSYDPQTNEIFLNPTHNATTLLHELSHFWLTAMFRMASSPNAPESVKNDAAAVLRWFNVDNLDAWNAMSLEEQRKHHEAWAYSAEAHFFGEGKAPTNDAELVSLFRTFARWVRAVYRHTRDVLNAQYRRLFGVDLPALTPEVRDVFDRLIASEDAIEAARVDRAMTPLLKDKPDDMSPEDWALYQKAERDSQDEALEKLQADSLRSIKWLGNNTARLARKMQAQTRKLRKQVEDEVRAALEKLPVYRAMQELRYGELDTGEGTVPLKLNLDEFRMLGWVGDKTAEEVESTLGVGTSGMLRRGGAPLDFAASMFGFESGADLVRQLVEAKPLDAAVREQADQRMLAEHSDLTDPEKVRAAIEKALHNEARTKMVAAELRWLTKVTAPIGLMTRAARAYARDVIGRKLVGQVRPHEHAQSEVRNRREAERWLIRGDLSKAASFKRRELVETQLEREALLAREDVQTVEELVKKLAKRDEKLATTRDTDFVAAARFLAATYGMMPGEKAPADYVAKLRAYNPQLAERLSDQLLPARRSPTEATTWKDLTVDEFRDVKETLEALWNQSLREKQFQTGDSKAKLDDIAAEVVAQDAKLPPPKGKPAGFVDRLKRLIARPEHWAHRRDGGEVGVFTRYFWRPVRAAVERYVVDRNRYTKKLADLVTELHPKLKQGLIEFRDSNGKLLHTFGKKNGGFGHSELVGALLHIGNDSNLKKLLVGRGWGAYDAEAKTLNSAEWDKFVQTMIDRGYITKEVMDFVQAVWDLNEELKPLAQKTHRDLFGFYFKEIEARPIATRWGNYRGGYVPAKLDEDAASASRVQSLADLEADFRKQFATTGRGFTRERAEDFAEPLSLDLELMPRHVDNVLRFAHIQPAIRDVERLARHRDVGAVLDARDPGVWQGMLLPWLQRVASQSITRPGKSKDVDAFWKFVRSSAGVSTMFANIPNALQQLTGVLTAALKVKPRYLFHGLGRLLNERGEVYAQIAEFSPFMANRQGRQVFDSIEQIEEVAAKKSPLAKARGWVQRHGYFLQSKMQNLVDPIVWTGAYKQTRDAAPVGTSDEDAHAEAVKQADAAVRMTQSSFDPTDVANYEEGTPFYRLWTMFSGYFNTVANLQADQFVKMSRAAGWAKAGAAFQLYALGFAAPMLVAEAITRTLRGRWEDEDDDGDVDVLTFDFLFMSQLRSAIAEVPVAGPGLIAPAINAFDNQPWNDRMTTSPAVSVLERSFGGTADAIKVLAGLKKDRNGNPVTPDGQVIRDPLTLLGLVFGLPGSTVGTRLGYAYDRASGAIEGEGLPSDAWALISGSAPRPAR